MKKSLLGSARAPTSKLSLGYSLVAPDHALIHLLTADVDYSMSWRRFMQRAGPQSPLETDVMSVEGEFKTPNRSSTERDDFILINYPNGKLGWMSALAWACSVDVLVSTIPQEVFTIGMNNPNLRERLCPNNKRPLYLNSTVPCIHNGRMKSCGVCFGYTYQTTYAQPITGNDYSDDWYVFRVIKR